MKKSLFFIFILFPTIIFSQTTLNLDMNALQSKEIVCMVNVFFNVDEEIFQHKYFIENDTINGIVHLTPDKWRQLPIRGKITDEDFCVFYYIIINGSKSEGIIANKLKMNKDNCFRFQIQDKKIILNRVKK